MTYNPSVRIPSMQKLHSEFEKAFSNIPNNFGPNSDAHNFLRKYLQIDKRLIPIWMQDVVINNFETNTTPLLVILQIINEYPSDLIFPQGPMIASYCLMHSNLIVKEAALKCFDEWNDPRYINILKYHTMPIKRLQDYLDTIINKLIKSSR